MSAHVDLDRVRAMCAEMVRELEPIARGHGQVARRARFCLALQPVHTELAARAINAGAKWSELYAATLSAVGCMVMPLAAASSVADPERYEAFVSAFARALERTCCNAPTFARAMRIEPGGNA